MHIRFCSILKEGQVVVERQVLLTKLNHQS